MSASPIGVCDFLFRPAVPRITKHAVAGEHGSLVTIPNFFGRIQIVTQAANDKLFPLTTSAGKNDTPPCKKDNDSR